MPKHALHSVALGAAVLMLAGCTYLEPDFENPVVSHGTVSDTTAFTSTADLPFATPAVVGSWQVVSPSDVLPLPAATWYANMGFVGLPPLVEKAVASNPSLKVAEARLKQAKAAGGAAIAALLPSVTGQADITRQRLAPDQSSTGNAATGTLNRGLLGFDWALDFFGRLSGQQKAASLQTDAARANVNAARLQLQNAVAQTYFALLAATVAEESWNLAMPAAEDAFKAISARYNAGDIDTNTYQAGVADLYNVRTRALEAAQNTRQLHFALSELLGETPQVFKLNLADVAALQRPALAVPQELSSTVVLNRPDVQVAANQLAAANANIGVARAAFLPNISLSATGGFVSSDLGNMFEWGNRTWSAGPVLTLPIFQGGALRANLRNSWAVYEEGVAQYRGTVVAAYRDVADAMVAESTLRAQAQNATATQTALTTTAQAMQTRYKAGDVARAEALAAVINAAQSTALAARAQAGSHAAVAALATSLGGGW